MKRKYVRPQIIIENFSLSTTIAGNCELDTPLPSFEASCGYPIRGDVVFINEPTCTTYPQDGMHEGFCYHVPTDDKNLFNS